MGFGGWYLGMYSGGFDASVYEPRARASATTAQADAAPREVDLQAMGKRVYNTCMSCHQQDGLGVEGNYPPLDGSRWVTGSPEPLAALVLHGLEGPITVEGVTYDNVMPAWDHLSDQQIAAVLTYIRSSWSNQAEAVSPELVSTVRKQTSDRRSSFTVSELEELEVSFGAAAEDESGDGAPQDTGAVEG
jgi:mono/diheme cytochrome c family protein